MSTKNISDDWTQNWEASIAVKVSAVVLWVMIAVSLGAIMFLLNDIESNLNKTFEHNGDRLAYHVGELTVRQPTPTTDELRTYLQSRLKDYGFPLIELTIGEITIVAGKKTPELETHYLRELSNKYPHLDGSTSTVLLRTYRQPLITLIEDKRNLLVLSVIAALCIFGIILTWIINKILTKPIQHLVSTTQRVSEGDLDSRLEINRKDEFGQLSRFFNEMLENLHERDKELRVALKEAEAATQAKSAFLANMSHEIRTPLTAIIGYADVLQHSKKSIADNMDEITTIIRNGKHLLQIINDILDLSKIEANKLDIELTSVNIPDIISDLKSIIEPQAKEKALDFSVNISYPLPKQIICEPLRLKQILLNLCSNAIKFTEKGYVKLNIKCDIKSEDIEFDIIDTGIGMTKEHISRIFNAFAQADSSTTRKYGGTGLGLYLSKQLAEVLGGSLSVESRENEGSTFKVTVNTGPLSDVKFITNDQDISSKTVSSSTPMQENTVKGNILLVEDSIDNQRLLNMYLTKMGASVSIAENGKIAVEMATNYYFDLILMDVQMPVMGGLEAVEYLREHGYTKPITALTANAMIEDRDKCFKAGCDDFISKPVNRQALYQIVEKYLTVNQHNHDENGAIVSELLKDDPSTFDIVQQYVNNLPALIEKMNKAFGIQNWDDFYKANHDLKGTGGGFGYPVLAKSATKIEAYLHEQAYHKIADLLNTLNKDCTRIYAGMDISTTAING